MSQNGRPLGILPFKDILPVLQKTRPADAMPEPVELLWLMEFLNSTHNAVRQIKEDGLLISLNELIKI